MKNSTIRRVSVPGIVLWVKLFGPYPTDVAGRTGQDGRKIGAQMGLKFRGITAE